MEITNLDWPEDDGLFYRLVGLCDRLYGLLDRVRGGEEVSTGEIEAVRRDALRLFIENDLAAFRMIVAEVPVNLN